MIYNATFIPDKEKVDLSAGALFDKVINLKLNCINDNGERESFVIRSDYELIYPDSNMPFDGTIVPTLFGGCVIRKCTNKPSIKVQCKLVSSNTGISIDVFVSNFFILTSDGKHLKSFNNDKYKIDTLEIAMGYWGQFKRPPEAPQMTYDDYFNITAERGADKITISTVSVVTTDKLPPDSVLHIKGFVADVYSSPVSLSQVDTVEKALKNPVTSSGKGFSEVCYNLITRRYLNKFYLSKKAGASLYAGRRNVAVSDIKDSPIPVKLDETGLMDKTDADDYGVRVYLSKKARELAIPKVRDAEDNERDKITYFEAGWTIGQTVSRIVSFMEADLDYTFNGKGDIMIYEVSEVTDPDNLYEAFDTEDMYEDSVFSDKALYNNKLPAVYNINIDAVSTITCPFFTFFEPFQYVEFASRYALTSTTAYFASYEPTIYRFLVINASISFATVDDVNEVQITAVASKKAKAN